MPSTKVKHPGSYPEYWHRAWEWLAGQPATGQSEVRMEYFEKKTEANTAANKARAMRQAVSRFPGGFSPGIRRMVERQELTFRVRAASPQGWALIAVREPPKPVAGQLVSKVLDLLK